MKHYTRKKDLRVIVSRKKDKKREEEKNKRKRIFLSGVVVAVVGGTHTHTHILRVKEKKRLKNPDRAEEVEYGEHTDTIRKKTYREYKKYD